MGQSHPATLGGDPTTEVVRAAGGLVVRRSSGGGRQVVVVHRPLRLDWSFPKGKLETGETFEQAAIREVAEETGLICRLGRFIGHTEYRDRKDRSKVVAYWVMEPESGAFAPSTEVDEMRWVDVGRAAMLLTYERDRQLLEVLAQTEEASSPS